MNGGRRIAAVVGSALALGAVATLWLEAPRGQWFYPRCAWHAQTGLACPGCGGLRCAHSLLHGEVAAAWDYNALAVAALPVAAVWWFVRRRRGLSLEPGPRAIQIGFAVALLFTIARNLPWAPFAALAP